MGDRRLVGRASELATARALLRRATEGDGQLLLLGGDPGIGKSRLAEEIAADASRDGALVAWGRCWEGGGAPPYWPWTDALNTLAKHVGRDALARAIDETAQDVAVVATALAPGPATTPPEDAGARFRLYEGVVDLLHAVTQLSGAAVAIVLDDVHVADPSSLLLLEFVGSRLTSQRVLVVAAYRHGELTEDHAFTATLGQLMRAPATTRLLLHGLDEDDVAALIADASGHAPKPAVVRQVREQTDGNPLYVNEVARLLAAEGRLDAGADTGAASMPRDVRETVLQRVARLPQETRAALDAAAVLGREFPVDVLVAITSPEALDHLEPAAASHLLAPAPNAIGRLRFSHAVIAQALYETTSPTQRMQLHLAAAQALEQRHGHDLDAVAATLALHYTAAIPLADVDRGVEYARRAGDRAMRQLAFEEAARLYALALAALGSAPVADAARRVDLTLAIGDAHARAGDLGASRRAFLEGATLARQLGDAERLGRAAVGYGGRFVWLRSGGDTRLVPLLEEAMHALPRGSPLWTRVTARLAGALRDDWDGRRRDELSAAALDAARALGDPDTLAIALTARLTATWSPDTIARPDWFDLVGEAERHATAAVDPERHGEFRWLRLISGFAVNDVATVREEVERYGEHATSIGQPSQQWYAVVMRTIVRLMDGPLDGAEELIDEGQRSGQFAQPWDAAASHRMAMAHLRREQGRLAEYERELRDAVVDFPPYRLFAALLALCLAEKGRSDEAIALARTLSGDGPDSLPFDIAWLYAMQVLAEAVCATGDAGLGDHVHARLAPYAHLVGQATGEVAIGSVSHHLGVLDALAGRLDDAVARFDAALAAHRAAGASVWIARTLCEYAAVLGRRGAGDDGDRAAAMTEEARDLATRLGIGAVTGRLAARAPAPSSAPPPASVLTRREEDVARLVVRGLSNKEIAAELYVSERTAESHVQHILTKLGFSSRAQIAAWAVSVGMTDTTT